jgi:hypothetical protein
MTRTSANRARARRRITRRSLKATAGSAAALAAAKAIFPGGAHVAHASGHEVRGAKLGSIALSDGAALPVAMEQAVPQSARIFTMTNGPAVAKMLEAALLRQEKRLELSLDPAYLMRRQRVPEFLSARSGPRGRSRPNRRLAWLGS